jgi:acetylornithine deacetylase
VDAVIIPEPLPGILSAQLGVMWVRVSVFGEPVHVLDTGKGSNAIQSALQVYAVLQELEKEWNRAKVRHDAYAAFEHAINLNLGKITGGVWASSVPSLCTFEARVGFFPDVSL